MEIPGRQKTPKIPAKSRPRDRAAQVLRGRSRGPAQLRREAKLATSKAQKKPDLMGNQIRLAGGNINRREIGKRNRETNRWERTLFGLAAKDALTSEKTVGGQSSLSQASGPHNSHRRNKRHAAKGSRRAAQPICAENFSHSPLTWPAKGPFWLSAGCAASIAACVGRAPRPARGRGLGLGPSEAGPNGRWNWSYGSDSHDDAGRRAADGPGAPGCACRATSQTPIGCIGAGFIMDECHLVAYRNAGFNPVAIASRRAGPRARGGRAARHRPRLRFLPGAAGRSGGRSGRRRRAARRAAAR